MIYKGMLHENLCKDGFHYTIFCKGSFYDFSDTFNCQLMDKIKLSIECENIPILNIEGRIKRKKPMLSSIYAYYVNNKNIDNVFRKCLNKQVIIEIKNVEVDLD